MNQDKELVFVTVDFDTLKSREITNSLSVYDIVEWVRTINNQNHDMVDKDTLKKPRLNSKHTPAEVMQYAKELEEYESVKAIVDEQDKAMRKANGINYDALEEYIRDASGLNTKVPEQYRDKVYSCAYETGHSYGYLEVYYKLCRLVEIFE